MSLYPLFFEPIFKTKVWGGRELEKLGKLLPPDVSIGESWELTDLPESIPDGRSRIMNGHLAGRMLREVIEEDSSSIMGRAALSEDGGFPLLIKYLDARENLSVQVHPTAKYVNTHPEAHLKSEAWIVVDADPGAVIYKGVKPDVTAEAFAQHIEENTVVDDLIAVPVQAGDCHYLPSGTCHALGTGIVVAEIQTPSDTTFRVYDWGRTSRELHVQQALQCIDFGTPPTQTQHAHPVQREDFVTEPLVQCSFFQIERITTLKATSWEAVTNDLPEVWMMLTGDGQLKPTQSANEVVDLSTGTTVLLPASLSDYQVELKPDAVMLRIMLPEPLDGVLA